MGRSRSRAIWRSASAIRSYGYYVTRDPFGAAGDFITAPEISQMFGELIGAWAAAVWRQMGAPARVNLIELGPGPRHADGGRAARRARRCRISAPPPRCIWSRRARCCARGSRRRSRSARRRLARAHRGRAGRARDRDRQRIRRCAAGRPVRQGSRRLAPAHGRPRRRPARPSSVMPDPPPRHFGGRAGRRDPGAAPRRARSVCWRGASRSTAARR